MHYLTRRPDEILTEVIVPDADGWRSTYWKLRRRGSFDFPVASVAAAAQVRLRRARAGDARHGAGAVASRPLRRAAAEALLVGEPLTDERIAAAAHAVYAVAKPMDNTDFELVWRKKMMTAAGQLRAARSCGATTCRPCGPGSRDSCSDVPVRLV